MPRGTNTDPLFHDDAVIIVDAGPRPNPGTDTRIEIHGRNEFIAGIGHLHDAPVEPGRRRSIAHWRGSRDVSPSKRHCGGFRCGMSTLAGASAATPVLFVASA